MRILDANYEQPDLEKIVQGASLLNQTGKKQLYELL